MDKDGSGPEEVGTLLARLSRLEAQMHETQTILGRCVLTTVAASFVAQEVGRELVGVVESAGLSPNLNSLLAQLDRQLQALLRSFEEAARVG